MLAVIQKAKEGYVATFERNLKHSDEKVWAMLTENEKLKQWFPELRVEDLRKGGVIKFDMQDGTFEEMEIMELNHLSVLEYTWGNDRVRFELYPTMTGCDFSLIEEISQITDHTPKDLAGWHVCLDVISALLDGTTLESRENEWKRWYEEYTQLIERFSQD
ncbi:MAG: SRPBCC family protein [Bacillota bacterium]